MRDTAVIIPCYNESARLDINAFLEYAARDGRVFFLFVNDGSTDRTQEMLQGLHSLDPDAFRLLGLERNSGKGEAVRRGVLHALESAPVFIGYWDADLATPLEAIQEFRNLLEDRPTLELVLGSRVRLLGREVYRSTVRHYLGRAFASLASLALALGVYDTQCGAKLFRASATTPLLFHEPFCSSWIFDVEILARLIRTRHRLGQPRAELVLFEFPLHRWCDVAGSKLKASDFLRAPLELLAIYRRYLAGIRSASANPGPHFGMGSVAARSGAVIVERQK
jgi:glycosyltransferase involved in cell wall biosynthesis